VTGIPGRISSTVSGLFDGIKDSMTGAWRWVSDRIADVVNLATGLPGKIAGVFGGMWDGIRDAFRNVINAIIRFWNGIDFKLPTLTIYNPFGSDWTVGGQTFGLPDIPLWMHSGGTVPGRFGENVVAMLQAGEHVTAAGRPVAGQGSSTTNIFNIPPGVDPDTLVDAQRRAERRQLAA